MYVEDCLQLVGDSYPNWDHDYVRGMKERWLPDDYQRIRDLSPGQVQRVATLLAIGHKPNLLVLDEPVASMDPGARREFLVSSRALLSTVNRLCCSPAISPAT